MVEYKELTLETFNKFMDDLKNELQKKPFKEPLRDDNGFPLLENGEINWELTQKEKLEVLKNHEKLMREDGCKKTRRKITNFMPKKKRRK